MTSQPTAAPGTRPVKSRTRTKTTPDPVVTAGGGDDMPTTPTTAPVPEVPKTKRGKSTKPKTTPAPVDPVKVMADPIPPPHASGGIVDMLVPFGKIMVGPDLREASRPKAVIAARANSIKRVGLLTPLLVRANAWAEDALTVRERINLAGVTLRAGLTRYLALQKLKTKPGDMVRCSVLVEGDTALDGVRALVENVERAPLDAIEEAMAYDRTIADGNTVADVAAMFGVTERYVRQRRQLCGLIPEFRDRVRSGKMQLSLAGSVAALSIDQQKELLDKNSGYLSTYDIRKMTEDSSIPVKYALFDVEAAKLPVQVDLFDDDNPGGFVVGARDQFIEHQRAAINMGAFDKEIEKIGLGSFIFIDRTKGDKRDAWDIGNHDPRSNNAAPEGFTRVGVIVLTEDGHASLRTRLCPDGFDPMTIGRPDQPDGDDGDDGDGQPQSVKVARVVDPEELLMRRALELETAQEATLSRPFVDRRNLLHQGLAAGIALDDPRLSLAVAIIACVFPSMSGCGLTDTDAVKILPEMQSEGARRWRAALVQTREALKVNPPRDENDPNLEPVRWQVGEGVLGLPRHERVDVLVELLVDLIDRPLGGLATMLGAVMMARLRPGSDLIDALIEQGSSTSDPLLQRLIPAEVDIEKLSRPLLVDQVKTMHDPEFDRIAMAKASKKALVDGLAMRWAAVATARSFPPPIPALMTKTQRGRRFRSMALRELTEVVVGPVIMSAQLAKQAVDDATQAANAAQRAVTAAAVADNEATEALASATAAL